MKQKRLKIAANREVKEDLLDLEFDAEGNKRKEWGTQKMKALK